MIISIKTLSGLNETGVVLRAKVDFGSRVSSVALLVVEFNATNVGLVVVVVVESVDKGEDEGGRVVVVTLGALEMMAASVVEEPTCCWASCAETTNMVVVISKTSVRKLLCDMSLV